MFDHERSPQGDCHTLPCMVLPRKRVQNYCFWTFDTIPKNGDLGAWTFYGKTLL